ncbi:hypothetical protein RR49_01178 [Microbacterium ginsengisoli]|uniref:Uncharacterized protein n=1 Tax=Microbacterium ginsengisoli TaxID=400772 RepID=A0A0F0M094_9MICO|nr:hypothetical protein [Microbacterium ginsengisoli]KJL37066.1 hypothetical protein RR49_01178 [Microbacterium ginsengisoli]MBN9207290.1 hypothetical protein [Microbacterium ginsengisoli]
MRKRLARIVRRLAAWRYLPQRAFAPLERLAFWLAPHSLTCKSCGARFVQPSFGSLAHARRAFDHYIDVHEDGSKS